MKSGLTLTIWRGETLYTLFGAPMTPPEVVRKYGYVLGGIPMAILKTVDGVAAEINPLGNLLTKLGTELPDNYKEIAVSPVKVSIKNDTIVFDGIKDTPLLDNFVDEINESIPQWQLEQNRIQGLINYTQSQLPVAAAIRGVSDADAMKATDKLMLDLQSTPLTIGKDENQQNLS